MNTIPTIHDHPARHRYELIVGEETVFCDYKREGDTVSLLHVEAPVALRGTGAAGQLMRGILELARAEDLKIIPLCGYAASWIRCNPQYNNLLA